MLNYAKLIRTKKPKNEVVALIGEVIPYIELDEKIARIKIGYELERLKKNARKTNEYYFYGRSNKYMIERNTKKVDIYSPRVVVNIEDTSDEVTLKLDFKYKALENRLFLSILLISLYFTGAFYSSSLTQVFGIIILGLIFLPGIYMFKKKSRKLLEIIERAVI